MRTECLFICMALIFLLSSSCSKKLEYEYDDVTAVEVVNGLSIHWSRGLPEEKKEIIRGIVNEMVYVEGGGFSMGADQAYDADARTNEYPVHYVQLSDYYICSYELTVAQLAGMENDISFVYPKRNAIYCDYSDWESFLRRLKEYTGLQFDFPTEAQWEYAARGGKLSNNYQYPGSDDWKDVWSDGSTTSIPNELGLFNMADSYSEWCKDIYSEYGFSASIDPCNTFLQSSEKALFYVIRGGCSQSNKLSQKWEEEGTTFFSFRYSKDDYRLCRSTARTYEISRSGDIILRPVINILDDEK